MNGCDKMIKLPILYTFIRCPYAIRARFALKYAGLSCFLREIDLKNKAAELLRISPKGTVPVLQLPDGEIIDESLKIILWALGQNDPQGLLKLSEEESKKSAEIIEFNDRIFVKNIHKYKYSNLYSNESFEENKKIIYNEFYKLESFLVVNKFLVSNKMSIADIAIFPFIRQVAQVDQEEFEKLGYKNLQKWLGYFLSHPLFELIMKKYPLWSANQEEIVF